MTAPWRAFGHTAIGHWLMHTGPWLWLTQSTVGPNITASAVCSIPVALLTLWRMRRRQQHHHDLLRRHIDAHMAAIHKRLDGGPDVSPSP